MGIWAPSYGDDEVVEIADSADEQVSSLDGVSCSVSLMCDWSIRHAVAADILPQVSYGVGVTRTYWPYGDFVNQPYATKIGIKPFSGPYSRNGQAMTYNTAILTVTYEKRPDTEPEDLLSESIEPTAEFLTLDHKRFRWTDEDGDILEEREAPGKLIRGLIISRTYYKIQSPLPAILLSAVGTVNHDAYTSSILGLTFPAETLLYTPPNLSRTITTDGSDGWDMTVKFMYKAEGWNKFWRAKSQQFERIYDTETDEEYENYPLLDYSPLLS
jgi:hypothetical protein